MNNSADKKESLPDPQNKQNLFKKSSQKKNLKSRREIQIVLADSENETNKSKINIKDPKFLEAGAPNEGENPKAERSLVDSNHLKNIERLKSLYLKANSSSPKIQNKISIKFNKNITNSKTEISDLIYKDGDSNALELKTIPLCSKESKTKNVELEVSCKKLVCQTPQLKKEHKNSILSNFRDHINDQKNKQEAFFFSKCSSQTNISSTLQKKYATDATNNVDDDLATSLYQQERGQEKSLRRFSTNFFEPQAPASNCDLYAAQVFSLNALSRDPCIYNKFQTLNLNSYGYKNKKKKALQRFDLQNKNSKSSTSLTERIPTPVGSATIDATNDNALKIENFAEFAKAR